MNSYRHRTLWMLALFMLAVMTGIGSLAYTNYLVDILKEEERKKVELWAEATIIINSADTENNLEFPFSIIENNTTIPVILTDEADKIISSGNFDAVRMLDSVYMQDQLNRIKKRKDPIIINLGNGFINRIYYKDSIILTQLIYYPYVQLTIIILFILVAYLAFRSSRKAADNQVWVSMSKETAHQLGTPTSSLAGWVEILQERHPGISITAEIGRDVERLEKITDRFSRIGSRPALKKDDIIPIISRTIDYLKTRSSSKVQFIADFDRSKQIIAPVNAPLFEWVIENLAKNAIDAMEGSGVIIFRAMENGKTVIIDVTDTGKGIPKGSFRKIFDPGYSTKQRGWGLGLSLAKRIVDEFHSGRIYVRQSEPGKGSCIRIILKK